METENFPCNKQHATSHITMGCQCDTKEPGGMKSMLWFLQIGHKTGWCDESLLEICAAINHKSSISSEAYGAPECTACNYIHCIHCIPYTSIAHILILRPEMSVGAPREVISSTIIDPKWDSSLQTFHTAGQICIYTDNTSDCLLKKKKKSFITIDFLFCGPCNFYTILQSEFIEF